MPGRKEAAFALRPPASLALDLVAGLEAVQGGTPYPRHWCSRTRVSFDTMAWGAFFIWWGITVLFKSLPVGTGAVGIGLILLGLNTVRALNGIPTSRFTITLGLVTLGLGSFDLAKAALHLPWDLPVFAITLTLLGVLFLARAVLANRSL
jgi:hypothetical protein